MSHKPEHDGLLPHLQLCAHLHSSVCFPALTSLGPGEHVCSVENSAALDFSMTTSLLLSHCKRNCNFCLQLYLRSSSNAALCSGRRAQLVSAWPTSGAFSTTVSLYFPSYKIHAIHLCSVWSNLNMDHQKLWLMSHRPLHTLHSLSFSVIPTCTLMAFKTS